MALAAEQLARIQPLWDKMLSHRFLLETRDGKIPDQRFAVWMRQDYLFVEAAIAFTNHAYIQFLLATAYRGTYAEAYAVLYTAEKAGRGAER